MHVVAPDMLLKDPGQHCLQALLPGVEEYVPVFYVDKGKFSLGHKMTSKL